MMILDLKWAQTVVQASKRCEWLAQAVHLCTMAGMLTAPGVLITDFYKAKSVSIVLGLCYSN